MNLPDKDYGPPPETQLLLLSALGPESQLEPGPDPNAHGALLLPFPGRHPAPSTCVPPVEQFTPGAQAPSADDPVEQYPDLLFSSDKLKTLGRKYFILKFLRKLKSIQISMKIICNLI